MHQDRILTEHNIVIDIIWNEPYCNKLSRSFTKHQPVNFRLKLPHLIHNTAFVKLVVNRKLYPKLEIVLLGYHI